MVESDPGKAACRVFLSHSPEASEALGEALGLAIEADPELARAGVVLALEGELGAGKTAIARGLARGLGSLDRVHSPSFTLMHTYQGRLPIYHFDAWMEGRERAFLEGGGAEWLEAGGVAVIEWASRVEAWLPRPRLQLVLEHLGNHALQSRRLTLRAIVMQAPHERTPRSLALQGLVRGLSVADSAASSGEIQET